MSNRHFSLQTVFLMSARVSGDTINNNLYLNWGLMLTCRMLCLLLVRGLQGLLYILSGTHYVVSSAGRKFRRETAHIH
jgi:hypothetical protein